MIHNIYGIELQCFNNMIYFGEVIIMISIIIPVYNAENSIKRAFDSLLNQTIGFENLEVILIDDNSTDDSPNIL